jgi:hypothetical protein
MALQQECGIRVKGEGDQLTFSIMKPQWIELLRLSWKEENLRGLFEDMSVMACFSQSPSVIESALKMAQGHCCFMEK